MTKTWGKWMRVERVTDRSAGKGEPTRVIDHVINLDHVARVYPFHKGTAFHFTDGDCIETTCDFEVACAALMLSQGPRPPMTREEVHGSVLPMGDTTDIRNAILYIRNEVKDRQG